MTATKTTHFPQDTVISELTELRRSQLLKLIIAIATVGWAYYILAAITSWPLRPDGVPLLVVLLLASSAAYALRREHYRAASWSLLSGMILATSLILAAHPDPLNMAFVVLAIPGANTLLGTRQAFLVTLLAWLSTIAALHTGTGGGPWRSGRPARCSAVANPSCRPTGPLAYRRRRLASGLRRSGP